MTKINNEKLKSMVQKLDKGLTDDFEKYDVASFKVVFKEGEPITHGDTTITLKSPAWVNCEIIGGSRSVVSFAFHTEIPKWVDTYQGTVFSSAEDFFNNSVTMEGSYINLLSLYDEETALVLINNITKLPIQVEKQQIVQDMKPNGDIIEVPMSSWMVKFHNKYMENLKQTNMAEILKTNEFTVQEAIDKMVDVATMTDTQMKLQALMED